MDWHKLQHTLFEMDPTDPREDLAKLQAQAQGGANAPVQPATDNLQESVEIPEGSLELDRDYSVSDFAALAGVQLNEDWKKAARRGWDDYNKASAVGLKNPLANFGKTDVSKSTEKQPPSKPGYTDAQKWKSFLQQHTSQLQDIARDDDKRKQFDDFMKKMTTVKEKDERKIKPRDPNSQYMNDLRKSGAMGAHKDKKKDAKAGKMKHKGQQFETIKDMLYAKLAEKK